MVVKPPSLALFLLAFVSSAAFASFESAPVHPLDISPDGTTLFAAHTADHRLAVFDISSENAPVRIAEIPVGLEPVTVRARTNDEVWVVNQVSDAISIVRVSEGNVVATLLAGDEPSDVVFAGSPERAFVSVSLPDRIRVFDPADLDAPPIDLDLLASNPRSLAVSLDGTTVYALAFDSQNRTTVVDFHDVEDNGGLPPPSIPMDPGLPAAPVTGLIVKHDGTHWVDETEASWDSFVSYELYDNDIIAIDVATLSVVRTYSNAGTTLFGLAVNPANGFLVVTNQEATNEIRFEPVLSGRFVRNRVTTINPVSGAASPSDLNAHIDYGDPAGNALERSLSLSIPTDVIVSEGGGTIYVAAFGSAKVGVLDSAGNVLRRIAVGAGPSGLALDEAQGRLFVLNHQDASLSVVDLADDSSVEIPLGFDPVPSSVRDGQRIFYSGEGSSAHGDLSCASCHVFAHMDNIAWDLGNPIGVFLPPPEPFPGDSLTGFHPMKGPMVTQTLRGMLNTEPFHWRGDRPELVDFNPAFVGLLGRPAPLTGTDFQLMEDFLFSLRLPPNPYRTLDNELPSDIDGGDPRQGEDFFYTPIPQGGGSCVNCHSDPSGGSSRVVPRALIQAISEQDMNVPQLRIMYEKTGLDAESPVSVRGFGSSHSGFKPSVFPHQLTLGQIDRAHAEGRHALAPSESISLSRPPQPDTRDIAAFLLAFDTGVHPCVGAQWTMDGTNEGAGISRVAKMVEAAESGTAGLIAKGREGSGLARGWVYAGSGEWLSDRVAEPPTSLAELLVSCGAGTEITFTGVLAGSEVRLGVDRDEDGFRDRDELDLGSDPGDPASVPPVSSPQGGPWQFGPSVRLLARNPARTESRIAFTIAREGPAELRVYDVAGRVVRTLVHEPAHEAGEFHVGWDLRDGRGRRVSSGVYFLRLSQRAGDALERVSVIR